MKIIGIVLTVGAIFFNIHLFGQSAPGAAGQTAVAPEWSLKDMNGNVVRSSDFKGKVVILDFWATWCGPCRAEIPNFVALQRQYGPQGLVVVGVSVDGQDGADAVKPVAQELGMNYPVVLADEATQAAFGGIDAIPTTFVIDREGRIVKEHVGFTDKDEFENEIKPLLKAG